MPEPLDNAALDQLFNTARSYNAWLDRDVSDAQIHAIYDLLKMGPTSANQQSGRLVWCKSPEAKARLAAHASEKNRPKITGAPVCVIIGMDLEFHEQLPWLFPHTDARSWFTGKAELRQANAFRNSSLQGAYLMLAARALGLDCGPMSGFDNAAVDAEFFADQPSVRSNFICSIGYGDPASIFARSPRPEFDVFNKLV
ncbi:MAG: malonic semialdehyde reductase [Sphingomonadales bacterium 32-68-7]|nr:MAG: malonic semialdehyde reductase [Sphingomonadales bacterium 12-68-11]OYX10473.1 MAG: malonic semialdehyde reductase [Sphingomonadales bacterium 32-68-7]